MKRYLWGIFSRVTAMIVFAAAVFLPSLPASAIPAPKGQIILYQPDGSSFSAIMRGDEFSSVLTDLQGHALAQDADGFWCYAYYLADGTLLPTSGRYLSNDTPWHIIQNSTIIPYHTLRILRFSKIRPIANIRRIRAERVRDERIRAKTTKSGAKISRKCIVLLAEFSDVKMRYTREDFDNMLNQKGYSYNGAEGSVADYFDRQLSGEFEFSFDVGPLITLEGSQKDYGEHSGTEKDKDPAGLVYQTCIKSADAGVDFSKYDDDGDGEVDNVFIFVAGRDEADGGGDNCIWSHQWYLRDGAGVNLTLGGKTINSYAISTELGINSRGTPVFATIGTFCHEYSHALGLMDMYDTDYEASGGVSEALWGSTALMDGGNSNNWGNTPPNYNAIDYDSLGAGNPEDLHTGSYSLEPINIGRRYLKYETGEDGEYYLIECRQAEGWDKYIGGGGLLIYHIDRSKRPSGISDASGEVVSAIDRWWGNEVNCRPDHQCADLIEASPDAITVRQVFFPYLNYDSFSSVTSPQFRFWDGTESPLAITNIRLENNIAKFNVVKRDEVIIPKVGSVKTDIFQDAAIIRWEADQTAPGAIAKITYGTADKTDESVTVKPYEEGKYSFTLDGLSPRTAYKVLIHFENGGIEGTVREVSFTTKSLYNDTLPFIFLNIPGRNEDGSLSRDAEIPLRVYNLRNALKVEWFFNGRSIDPSADGYYHPTSDGELKAVIEYIDGKDLIVRQIHLK